MDYLKIRNWDKWQSYRKDRSQPSWIKLHRCVMRNPEWVSLSDAQRGQLVAIWLLAADHNGTIPASPYILKRLCHLDSEPDLKLFITQGFIDDDNQVVTKWLPDGCQSDAPDKIRVEKSREEKKTISSEPQASPSPPSPVVTILPTVGNGNPYPVTDAMIDHWQTLFPGIDITQCVYSAQAWLEANPTRRKTARGMSRFLVSWFERQQNRSAKA